MFKKLRLKFIMLSMLALLGLLTVIIAGINIINYNSIIKELDETLYILANNKGIFPEVDEYSRFGLSKDLSPEAPYQNRYFSVLFDTDGEVLQADTGQISAVDTEQAIEYAESILSSDSKSGFVGNYRYICYVEDSGIRITFLDCREKVEAFKYFLYASLIMAMVGYLIFFVIILFFSGRIVRPVIESYEKQKRFITDAGHEIKTPLAIIKADVEVLEMDLEENEWLTDIKNQSNRLTDLTNDLIYLSRMEEANDKLQMIEFPLSDVSDEMADSFRMMAQSKNKTFICQIEPMLTLKGNEKSIRQLISILLENAMKYSPDGGTVSITVAKQNKNITLSVYNTTTLPVPGESLPMLFERFYRVDASHNSETGGHGIGLSVAKAIVTAHSGKIQAKTDSGNSLTITASFPC